VAPSTAISQAVSRVLRTVNYLELSALILNSVTLDPRCCALDRHVRIYMCQMITVTLHLCQRDPPSDLGFPLGAEEA
jgi:hypothetical protein